MLRHHTCSLAALAGLAALMIPPLVAQAAPAAAAPAEPALDGETAPAGRWYTAGGSAARNGTSRNPPVLRVPAVRWRIEVDGTLCGEPLVWDDRVVLAVRVNDRRRQLQVRRLQDGQLVAERTINSTADVFPSLWGNEIVSRIGTEGLELQRFGAKLTSLRQLPRQQHVGPPLRFGTSIYVALDGALSCLRASDLQQRWRTDGGRHVGAPTLLGNVVYTLCEAGGGYLVAAHDRSSGRQVGSSAAVQLSGDPGDEVRIVAARSGLFVLLGERVVLSEFVATDGTHPSAMQLPLPLAGNSPTPLLLLVPPAVERGYRLLAEGSATKSHLLLVETGQDSGYQLDANEHHRALIQAPPTTCGGIAYFGACAVDLGDHRVLWRLLRHDGRPLPIRRLVPAGSMLLLAGDRELIAFGDDAPADPVAAELDQVRAEFEHRQLRQAIDDAMAATDWDLALECLGRCRSLAVDAAWTDQRDKEIVARSKKSKPPNAGQRARADAIRAALATLGTAAVDAIHARVAGFAASRPAAELRHGLRLVLRQRPDHAAATAMVRAMMPADLAAPEPFRAADWLDFLDATAQTKVAFLDAAAADFADASLDSVTAQNKQQLLQWRQDWRPDLQALLSDRLLLFSSVDQPGSLARALSAGELVCDTLEALFADRPQVRHDPRPMLVFLYSDRQEYLLESQKAGMGDVTWTAGYYSDSLTELVPKSRLFVPADDAGFAGVLPTLAHELTHHWLMDRCRALVPDKGMVREGPRAFWIVEGFAGLVEQFSFDLQRRTAQLGGADLNRADVVASAKPEQLIAWDRLAALGRPQFAALQLRRGAPIEIPSTLRLGIGYRTTGVDLFYAQSAMLARYLYEAEGGRHRRALLDYVLAYYAGRVDDLDFQAAFGVTAKELGPKVEEFARALVR